jgi:hypothetical protein
MGSVPSKVGVFFGKTDKVSEGWYWTDTSIGQKRKAAITGPFETKEKAVEKPVLANLFLHYAFDAWGSKT